METAVRLIQAATGLASVIIAWLAVTRSRDGAREQMENARVERWLREFSVLVRDPAMQAIGSARAGVLDSVNRAASAYEGLLADEMIRIGCDEIQQQLLQLRTDLAFICASADEHQLYEGLCRALETAEEDLLKLLETFPTRIPGSHERRHAVHGLFARLQRGVIQYGKDGRARLNAPLKRLPAADG